MQGIQSVYVWNEPGDTGEYLVPILSGHAFRTVNICFQFCEQAYQVHQDPRDDGASTKGRNASTEMPV